MAHGAADSPELSCGSAGCFAGEVNLKRLQESEIVSHTCGKVMERQRQRERERCKSTGKVTRSMIRIAL